VETRNDVLRFGALLNINVDTRTDYETEAGTGEKKKDTCRNEAA